MNNTKVYHDYLNVEAHKFAKSNLSLREAALEMSAVTSCHYYTARRLIERARNPRPINYTWGGKRPGAGRPVKHPEPL